jgi:2-hydroxy-3-keto-5-methylthiopentenyl-1-phosphate phosphatase
MTKQEEFYQAVLDNDIHNVTILLNNHEVNPSDDYNYAIQYSATMGNLIITQLILKNPKFNYKEAVHRILSNAGNGNTEILKLLLKNKKIDPSCFSNFAINSLKDSKKEAIQLLWRDKRVKDTLENDHPKLYDKMIKEQLQNKINNF